MRFVFAIGAFVVAAVLIVVGFAQQTVFKGPDTLRVDVPVAQEQPFIVIDGSVLAARPGTQTVTATGSEHAVVAYARTADVTAWLDAGGSSYNLVTLDAEGEMSAKVVTPKAPPAPAEGAPELSNDPRGSDLWLGEFSETESVIAPINIDEDMSVLVAADGTETAPGTLGLSWPLDNSTPWAGPMIVAGLGFLLLGIILYILAFLHVRRSRGPRRKSAALAEGGGRRRRSIRARIALPMTLAGAVALTGCSASYWPQAEPTPSSTAAEATSSATPLPGQTAEPVQDTPEPSVTGPQLERIVSRISAVVTEADEKGDAELIRTRVEGSALEGRLANYKIRETEKEFDLPADIPGQTVEIALPQATDGWPRTVMAVVKNADDATVAPAMLVLRQSSPRDNYLIERTMTLEPKVRIPEVPPVTLGSSLVPADSSFLTAVPSKLAEAYGDVVEKGQESEFAVLFESDNDTLRRAMLADRESKRAQLADTAEISFVIQATGNPPIALSTNDRGALVALDIAEIETVKATHERATITPGNSVKALAGITGPVRGSEATYTDQVLFYVPPAGSDEKIRLLGFSQFLTSAKEIS